MSTSRERGPLPFLYQTLPGRMVLKAAASRGLSRWAGRFMDSPLSRGLIPRFVRRYGISLEDFETEDYLSFNAFFTRRIRAERRPLPEDPRALIAPCDGRLSAYRIREGTVLPIKQSSYTVGELLGGDAAAELYREGICLVFRLCVDDYHRYCFPDSGNMRKSAFIPGELHTVRPVALREMPVFVRNCREFAVLDTEHFGTVTQVEVGAMLVGRIENHPVKGSFVRGEEKGMFRYGGSTVVLLLEKDRAEFPEALFRETREGREIPVRMGQVLGRAAGPPDDPPHK